MSAALKSQLPPELAELHQQVFGDVITAEDLAKIEGVSVRTILRRNDPFVKRGKTRMILIDGLRAKLTGGQPAAPAVPQRGRGRPRKIQENPSHT
jgi:hypothetical protein